MIIIYVIYYITTMVAPADTEITYAVRVSPTAPNKLFLSAVFLPGTCKICEVFLICQSTNEQ